jgi:hypothetical protein
MADCYKFSACVRACNNKAIFGGGGDMRRIGGM